MTPIQQDEEPVKCYCRNAVQAHFCEEKCDVYMKAQQDREIKQAAEEISDAMVTELKKQLSPSTPIQQAIEFVNKMYLKLEVDEAEPHIVAMSLYLQSLLPVEKEWAKDAYMDGYGEGWNDNKDDFEQYYSQFNEGK